MIERKRVKGGKERERVWKERNRVKGRGIERERERGIEKERERKRVREWKGEDKGRKGGRPEIITQEQTRKKDKKKWHKSE